MTRDVFQVVDFNAAGKTVGDHGHVNIRGFEQCLAVGLSVGQNG